MTGIGNWKQVTLEERRGFKRELEIRGAGNVKYPCQVRLRRIARFNLSQRY